jgi:hypothetical protein
MPMMYQDDEDHSKNPCWDLGLHFLQSIAGHHEIERTTKKTLTFYVNIMAIKPISV